MTYQDDLREKLAGDIDVTTWRDLRTHAARDRVFLVAPSVPLLDAAVAIGSDDAEKVGAWVASGALTRPTATQLAAWEKTLDKPFDCVILSPYVVAAERLD
ncbi:MAG: DUF2288 family protein [Deltaproteobacteria bacterium]|nr:MAG: DUF2288 family protein [Deltaproteobacteria bacterium]